MTAADDLRLHEALDWVRRIHDPAFADWDAHVAWLEADPHNSGAFDRASLLIEDATTGLSGAVPVAAPHLSVNDNEDVVERPSRRWGRWGTGLGAAAAAIILGVVGAPVLLRSGAQPYVIQTAPGQFREVTIGSGTRIMLNGDSAVRLDHADPRLATIEKGEAFFTVTHDAAHPFTVQAGNAIFQDVGTSFDVTQGTATEIAVREGALLYDPKGAALHLAGGQLMRIADGGATIGSVDPASVGGWRSGRLIYRDAPLSAIAADIARNTGQPVTVDRSIAARTFSGVIIIDADRTRMFQRIAGVTGVAIQHDATGWRMVPSAP